MRKFKRDRGFFVFAQNGKTDYLRLAYALALSLKATQSEHGYLTVAVTPGTAVPDHYRAVFDEVLEIVWLDEAAESDWKLENEWKAFHMTPYRETIKLDADMLFTSDISRWWDILARQDVWACTDVETYRGELVDTDIFRKVFTANDLPNVYTAFMYFKTNDAAQELFEMAEVIYHNWQKFFYQYLDETRPTYVSTDVVFALAVKLLGRADEFTFSGFSVPRFVHMKTQLQGWPSGASENWLTHLACTITPDLEVRVGRFKQILPLHYHLKEVITDDVIEIYEKAVNF